MDGRQHHHPNTSICPQASARTDVRVSLREIAGGVVGAALLRLLPGKGAEAGDGPHGCQRCACVCWGVVVLVMACAGRAGSCGARWLPIQTRTQADARTHTDLPSPPPSPMARLGRDAPTSCRSCAMVGCACCERGRSIEVVDMRGPVLAQAARRTREAVRTAHPPTRLHEQRCQPRCQRARIQESAQQMRSIIEEGRWAVVVCAAVHFTTVHPTHAHPRPATHTATTKAHLCVSLGLLRRSRMPGRMVQVSRAHTGCGGGVVSK